MTTLREHLEEIRDAYTSLNDPEQYANYRNAVAALAILDAATRIGEEDFEWSDTDRLVPDPEPSDA